MVDRWIHFTFSVHHSWGLPISGAMNRVIDAGKVKKPPPEVGQMAIHIATRIEMLKWIVKRTDRNCVILCEAVKTHEQEHVFSPGWVFIPGKGPYTFDVDEELIYNLIIDIDSLLFELNACSELVRKYIEMLHKHIDKYFDWGAILNLVKNNLRNTKGNINWYGELDKHRNFFIHAGTPYIAVDISKEEENTYDFIMTENLKEFTDTKKFIRLSEIRSIVKGFDESMSILKNHIIELYTNLL